MRERLFEVCEEYFTTKFMSNSKNNIGNICDKRIDLFTSFHKLCVRTLNLKQNRVSYLSRFIGSHTKIQKCISVVIHTARQCTTRDTAENNIVYGRLRETCRRYDVWYSCLALDPNKINRKWQIVYLNRHTVRFPPKTVML